MKYGGKKEDADDFFPVIESFNDSFGNGIENPDYGQVYPSEGVVAVGDFIEINVSSIDPLGDDLEYSIAKIGEEDWCRDNKRVITFQESDIGKSCDINVQIRNLRDYHAYSDFDDFITIEYCIVPIKWTF